MDNSIDVSLPRHEGGDVDRSGRGGEDGLNSSAATRRVLRSRGGRSQNQLDHLAVTPLAAHEMVKSNMAGADSERSRLSMRQRQARTSKAGQKNPEDGAKKEVLEKIYKKYNDDQDRVADGAI